MNGKFITIEGIEGAGKSTVMNTMLSYLQSKNISVVATREPGGTILGEKIRTILLDKHHQNMHSDTELLLMFAARAQHWQEKILPNLQAGNWVISDRFVDSSFAYQGGGRGTNIAKITELAHWVLGKNKPDLTLLLDINPTVGLARAKNRGNLDRFESEQLVFFNKVRKVFLELAKHQAHFTIINAESSETDVQQQAINALKKL